MLLEELAIIHKQKENEISLSQIPFFLPELTAVASSWHLPSAGAQAFLYTDTPHKLFPLAFGTSFNCTEG